MPVMRSRRDGKEGRKWGSKGFCYIGPRAERLALRQGQVIEESKSMSDTDHKVRKVIFKPTY